MNRAVRWTASFFGTGYSPIAPGTAASLAALALGWWLNEYCFFLAALSCVVGLFICKPAVLAFNSKDPSRFVLDEVAGMLISLLWLPKTLFNFIAAFILFRVFDIIKPWPIRAIDKNPHPSSIMWDDIAAGVIVNGLIQLALNLTF